MLSVRKYNVSTQLDGEVMDLGIGKGLRLGFFGSFYPFVDRLGSASTSMVALLDRLPEVSKITVFAPYSAKMMNGNTSTKIELVESWKYDDPLSLLRTLKLMKARKSDLDLIIFNIYVTSFGKSRIVNALGLLMPSLASKFCMIPTTVYMHNLVETQDIENLGYHSSTLSKNAAILLERLIFKWCRVVMPLRSQTKIAESVHRRQVHQLQIPYLEAVASNLLSTQGVFHSTDRRKPNILLFGSWGPQKDLESGLSVLKELLDEGLDFDVKIAGRINSNFPSYSEKFRAIKEAFSSSSFSFIGEVDESLVESVFSSSNVLFLPYNGAGGYSGVMNIGALYGLKMIAYDLPQLREFSQNIKANAFFVRKGDKEALKFALRQAIFATSIEVSATSNLTDKLRASESAVSELLRIAKDGAEDRLHPVNSPVERKLLKFP